MQNVPKIVRERLQAATPAVNHPAADVLTAFAEKSLPGLERDIVLEHLAQCRECRDVLALALPATDVVETVATPARGGWLTWPALRWGFVAAGIVAIASLPILRYQRPAQTVASKQVSRYEDSATEAQTQPPAPAAGQPEQREQSQAIPHAVLDTDSGSKDLKLAEPKEMARADAPARVHVPQGFHGTVGITGGPVRNGPNAAFAWQQQGQSQSQQLFKPAAPAASGRRVAGLSTSAPVPPSSEAVQVQAQAPQLNTESTAVSSQPAEPTPWDSLASAKVDKAKPATATASPAGAAAPGPMTLRAESDLLRAYAVPLPRWTINSAGVLQRSFDQGNTWLDVDVNANPAVSANLVTLEAVGKTLRAKEEKDANHAFKKQAVPAPTFRAVAASGADVWAGGSGGVLYHSVDAGNHWTRIVPSSAGTILTTDIMGLEFSDTQHGKITTSTQEIWTTSDSGQTWQKQ